MALQIIATIVVLWWGLQGANLTVMTARDGYSPIWVGFQALVTLALLFPLYLVWR